jgi:hypothetical protein
MLFGILIHKVFAPESQEYRAEQRLLRAVAEKQMIFAVVTPGVDSIIACNHFPV